MTKADIQANLMVSMMLGATTYVVAVAAALGVASGHQLQVLAKGIGLAGGVWTLALLPAVAIAYLTFVEAVIPIGVGTNQMVRWGLARIKRDTSGAMLANDAWHLRVVVCGIAILIVNGVSDHLS